MTPRSSENNKCRADHSAAGEQTATDSTLLPSESFRVNTINSKEFTNKRAHTRKNFSLDVRGVW